MLKKNDKYRTLDCKDFIEAGLHKAEDCCELCHRALTRGEEACVISPSYHKLPKVLANVCCTVAVPYNSLRINFAKVIKSKRNKK